ncbi:15697_t:CDS:2 [Gigaspora margarita]|uniref:15697_t:CDS:1 n=1 Tax=Gigaspora margarita TaxID=4874 RepID=A0ABN7VB63_GIGMA|nr:15697_t:CDS:2 [Gigaspora margarita]
MYIYLLNLNLNINYYLLNHILLTTRFALSQINSVIKKYNAEVNCKNQNGKTALHWAAKNGYTSIIEALMKNKARVDECDNNGDSSLFYAVKAGRKKGINILINHQANVNHTNKNGEIALHKAAYHAYQEIVRILIEKNANIKAVSNNGWTTLHFAAAAGHVEHTETVKYLLEVEAKNEQDFNKQYFYPIYFAAKKKYENIVKLLSEKTYDIKLHYTAGKEDIEIVKFLLMFETKHFIIDELGRTPLHWAAFEGYDEIVKNLVENDIKLVDFMDNNKETALYEAVWNGHIKIVEFLYNQGAKIYNKNINGWKPLHLAAISCQVDVFKFLKNKEVNFQMNEFFEQLDGFQLNNSKFEKFYNHDFTKKLIERFRNFESQFKLKGSHDIALYFYQFFLKLIEHAVKFSDKQDKKALSYLYICALSKICNLKSESKSNLIIDINRYFEKVQNDIILFKEANKHMEIKKFSNQYEKSIKQKIEEAYNIKDQIIYEMNKIVNEINQKIILLIEETREIIKKANENKQNLEAEQTQTISVVGGPIGIASDVIKRGINIAEVFISEDNKNKSNFEISSDIKVSLKNMEEMVKSEENEIIIAEQQLKKLVYELKEIKDELVQTQTKLEELKKKNENTTTVTDPKTNVELKVIYDLNIAIETTEKVIELYDKYQKDKENLDALSISIKQADEDIKKLKQFEENINKAVVPMIDKMQNDINNIENKINNKSHVFLDLTKWKVQTSLENIRNEIQKISKGFNIQEDTIRYMEKLDEGITTLINIYNRIQDYYDQVNLASYIAHIYSATNKEDTIIELEQEIRNNILIGHFKRAKNAFKQWVFPFANVYLKVLESLSDDQDIDSIMSQIEILYSEIQERNVVINEEDKFLVKDEFNSEYESSTPFFVWKNEIYGQEISKLLSGEEITIKAEITKSDHDDKNAIKFNEIGIRFKSRNKTMQYEIDCELKYFNINMVHLGNSYYQYNNKFYLIISHKQEIFYSFEKKNTGEPLRNNEAYDKIKRGELMLSPYTMWKIKLKPINRANFSKLIKFKNEVDLELVGHGKYIIDKKDSNNLNLIVEDYYKEYKIDLF